jgi:hypothetical protein
VRSAVDAGLLPVKARRTGASRSVRVALIGASPAA